MRICTAMLLFGLVALAQDPPQAAKGNERTLTGCLAKGADVAQHYKFTDQDSGREVTVTGAQNMEKHVGHTVRITGSMTNKVFNVTKMEHVSETCEATGGSTTK